MVSISMYEKMVCIVNIGMYLYVLVSINLHIPVLDLLVCMVCTGLYLCVWVSNDMYYMNC